MEVLKMIFRFHVSLRGGVFHHDSGSTFWGAWNHVMKGHAQSSCVCRMARRCHWLTPQARAELVGSHAIATSALGMLRDQSWGPAWQRRLVIPGGFPPRHARVDRLTGSTYFRCLALLHWTSIFQALFKLRNGDFLGLPTSGRSKISNRIFSQNWGVFLPGLSWWLSTFFFANYIKKTPPNSKELFG